MEHRPQTTYGSIFDELLSVLELVEESKIKATSGKVYKLARYMGRVPAYWPIKPWITYFT